MSVESFFKNTYMYGKYLIQNFPKVGIQNNTSEDRSFLDALGTAGQHFFLMVWETFILSQYLYQYRMIYNK